MKVLMINGSPRQNGNTARALKEIADARGEKLHQLALQWVLRDEVVTSALIGASRPEQITDNAAILSMPPLTEEEIRRIDSILA